MRFPTLVFIRSYVTFPRLFLLCGPYGGWQQAEARSGVPQDHISSCREDLRPPLQRLVAGKCSWPVLTNSTGLLTRGLAWTAQGGREEKVGARL